jgi:hypothetical protein
MALFDALADDFSAATLDAGQWVAAPGATVTGGELRVTATLASQAAYAIGGSSVAARLVPAPATGTSTVTSLRVGPGVSPGDDLGFAVDTVLGTLRCEVRQAPGVVVDPVAALKYDPVAHARLRVSVAGGLVGWEASSSGAPGSWAMLRGGVPAPGWVGVENQALQLAVTRVGGTAGGFAVLDDVNLAGTVVGGRPLVDEFDAPALGAIWQASSGTPTQTGGRLVLDPGDALLSSARVNLTGSRQWVAVFGAPATVGSEAVVSMTTDDGGALRYRITVGAASVTLSADAVLPDGTTAVVAAVPYDPVGMRFLQFRESGGRVFFEVGPSTVQLTVLEPGGRLVPFSVTSLDLEVFERGATPPGAYADTYSDTY